MAKKQVVKTEPEMETEQEVTIQLNKDSGLLNLNIPIDNELKWYVVSTHSGHENKVAQQIDQRVKANGLDEQITEILVPTHEKTIAKDGKKKTTEERLFPGYVIIKMQMNDATWHLIRNTEGVTGFIGPSKRPTALPDNEVKAIMAYTQVKQTSYETAFHVGDPVKVADGPFKDLIGNIQEINQDKGQLTVLLSMFGREVPVQLDFLQVTSI